MSFWCLQFSQKTNQNNLTWGTIVAGVKSNCFVRFLGESKIPKRHFEINWSLKCTTCTFGPAQSSNFQKLKAYETKPAQNLRFCLIKSAHGRTLLEGLWYLLMEKQEKANPSWPWRPRVCCVLCPATALSTLYKKGKICSKSYLNFEHVVPQPNWN